MKINKRYLSVLPLFLLLAGAHGAPAVPPVSGAVGAAGGVTGAAAGRPAAALGGVAGAANTGPGGSNAAAGSGLNSGVSGAGNAGEIETIGMRQDRLRAEASANGQGTALAPGLAATDTHSVGVALDVGPTVTTIRSAAFATREQLTTDVDQRMDAGAKAMVEFKERAKLLDASAQAEFKAAVKDADARAKQLKKSVNAARKDSEQTWGKDRDSLAADYEAYASAMARAEAATAPRVQPAAASVDSSTQASGTAAVDVDKR